MALLPTNTPGPVGAFLHPALVAGHPGHELKVFGWMARHTPQVYLVTDGSGRSGVSRVPSTAAVLTGVGASPGEVFGFLSDAEIYQAMLQRDVPLFVRLVDDLAASFVKRQIDFVAGDAAEGFNPTHDLCRVMINAAVMMAERLTGRPIANFEFCLTEWERPGVEQNHDGRCLHFILDDQLLAQKLAAAQRYAELEGEFRSAIAQRGRDYFRVECFRKVVSPALPGLYSGKPPYELSGEARVAEGAYPFVIRLEEHVVPLAEAILNHAAHAAVEASPVLSKS